MKAILDESLPESLVDDLPGHLVSTVKREGWKGIKNGELLALIEAAGFEAFITADKRMQFEQVLEARPFAVLLLSTNHRLTIEPHVAKVAEALETAVPGKVTLVECGVFVPKRFRPSRL